MLSQIIAVTGVNIRSIPARFGSSTVAVIGIAGVVLVFVAVLSIAEGVAATMKASGDPGLVLILRAVDLTGALRRRRSSAETIRQRGERAASRRLPRGLPGSQPPEDCGRKE